MGSSDKDSVAPERLTITICQCARANVGMNNCPECGAEATKGTPYIRDDGDLIPRATVVKRLREVAADNAEVAECGVTEKTRNMSAGVAQITTMLADEFEAADKDLELK